MDNYITPLACLLKVLNISYTELANVLGIDRSVVNKWALGTLTFRIKSKHYHKVIDYILEVNKRNGTMQLEKFFSTMYAVNPNGENYLLNCIQCFFSKSHEPINLQYESKMDLKDMIHYKTPSSTSIKGQFEMLMQMFNEVASSLERREIYLFDNEQFKWIIENGQYYTYFKEGLIELLNKGHQITMISDISNLERYIWFSKRNAFLYSYNNFTEYHYISNEELPINISYYAIKGHHTIHSRNFGQAKRYTIAFKDPLSQKAFATIFETYKAKSRMHLIAQSHSECETLFSKIHEEVKNQETIYLCSPALSFITMSRELLLEIMEQNQVKENKLKQTLAFYDLVRSVLKDNGTNKKVRQLCHFQNLKSILEEEHYHYEALSLFAGKEIILTQALMKRHIEDTIYLLEQNENYEMGLLRFQYEKEEIEFNFFCKANHFFLACNKIFKCVQEPKLINEAVQILDKEWGLIPEDYKANRAVVNKLRTLIKIEAQRGNA